MTAFARVKQWDTFARIWHLFDAKWQNPIESAPTIAKYLKGAYKPVYHPMANCGDHVIVINTGEIALPGDEWRLRMYFHHTGYPRGATWTRAWELHEKNPTMVMEKAVYGAMDSNLSRRHTMMRLHLFKDENVPEELMKNVTNQIRPLRPVPRSLYSYSEEEIEKFPKIVDYPEDYIIQ